MKIMRGTHPIASTHGGAPLSRSAPINDTGQALIELALVLPILLLMLVGAAEFGHLAYAAIEVANAARAGVAYGAQNLNTCVDATGMQRAALNDAPDVTSMTAIASAPSCACSTGVTVTCSNAGTSCPSPARISQYVKVNTTAAVAPLFNYPGISKTFTVTGQAIMEVEDQ